ncbi:MAG: ferrous iron transport protein B [Lewinella sp.]|nr:ferrous iron transport protein B [Lewinella sp.]
MTATPASGSTTFRIALVGNPNSGKSSVFNRLTGLRQKVGNFPGVTVDKKMGALQLDGQTHITFIDFPGAYSFYPTSQDERMVVQTLANPRDENYPDAVLYVADFTRLEKHLLLFTQIRDLGLPIALVLNMADMAERAGRQLDVQRLITNLGAPVVLVSSRTGQGFDDLAKLIRDLAHHENDYQAEQPFYTLTGSEQALADDIARLMPVSTPYHAILLAHHYQQCTFLSPEEQHVIGKLVTEHGFHSLRSQVDETMLRYDRFTPLAQAAIAQARPPAPGITAWLDRWLTHRVVGPVVFFALMFLIFQAIFAWAGYPMDIIDWIFGGLGDAVRTWLPDSWVTSLIADGILPGLGGILVFVPQIAILFFLISLLEEVGYMARAAFMFDRLMQVFGLNGRSLIALISSGACAIPAIMSTRTISNWKERLTTILVAPFISCSARIPVYTVLIGFAVPAKTVGGVFNLQGLAFMGLYVLGILAAFLSALVFKYILKTNERSYLMLELPEYRSPVMRNVGLTVWEKVKTFVLEAGQVILIISMVLWALASYGPSADMAAAEAEATRLASERQLDETAAADLMAAEQLEASYAGHLGKAIEPVIAPLGFDWKIGVAVISSFAAREVFVGTMATIYSIGSAEDEFSVRERLARERNPRTGELVYNRATSWSLLIFYVFAMMCMSTLAVVKRETRSWKWPAIQFFFMTGLAYVSSLLVYQVLS